MIYYDQNPFTGRFRGRKVTVTVYPDRVEWGPRGPNIPLWNTGRHYRGLQLIDNVTGVTSVKDGLKTVVNVYTSSISEVSGFRFTTSEVLNFRFAHEEAQRFRMLLLHFMNVNREEHR